MNVEILQVAGTDLDIVNAARVSYAAESQLEHVVLCFACGTEQAGEMNCQACGCGVWSGIDRLAARDVGLIMFLMKKHHGTPFEMAWLKFRVTCPIFVAREWQRHRIASYNEMSSRYVEMPESSYAPPPEDIRRGVGKQGDYHYESVDRETATYALDIMRNHYRDAYRRYNDLLKMGVAKEVARNILPLAQETQFITASNLRAWFNFLALRNNTEALREICYLAQMVEDVVGNYFPESYNAFVENGRVAP